MTDPGYQRGGQQIVGTYNATPPTLADRQQAPLQMDANGQVKIAGNINAVTSAVATAAAPTYTEGSTNPLSMDLAGGIRITGTINASSSLRSTTAAPSYLNGTDNPFSSDLSGNLRTLATQNGAWTVAATQSGAWTVASTQSGAWTVAATQSGSWSVSQSGTWNIGTVTAVTSITNALPAGSNIIGNIRIDQTTPGTTNAVDATNFPDTLDVNSGNLSNSTIRVTLATNSAAIPTWGHGATAASIPANAQYKGLRGTTANPTAVTDGQLVGAQADKMGRQTVVLSAVRDLVAQQVSSVTNTTETTIVTAGGANVFNDLVSLNFVNSGSTAVEVTIRDTTGGSAVAYFYVPAGDMRGQTFTVPFKQTSSNANWTMQASGSTTTLRCTAQFVKNL